MGKDFSHIIKDIFRLLTLEELKELALNKKKHKAVPLTEIILSGLEEAPVFGKEGRNLHDKDEKLSVEKSVVAEAVKLQDEEEYKCAENVAAVLAEYHYYCQEAEKKIFSPSVRKKKRSRKAQISGFILKERKKLEEVNFKLKRQEIVKLYRENSQIGLKGKKEANGEHSNFDVSGILLKKRA